MDSSPSRHTLCTESATEELGSSLSGCLGVGDVVCLRGELGVGKSVVARAIARGLGVNDTMPSPSYTIVEAYEGRVPVLHIDLYRLGSEEEFEMLGILEQMEQSVSLVEWPERGGSLLERSRFDVSITMLPDGCRAADVAGTPGR